MCHQIMGYIYFYHWSVTLLCALAVFGTEKCDQSEDESTITRNSFPGSGSIRGRARSNLNAP